MNRKTILTLVTATLLAGAIAEPVFGYTLLSPRRRWKSTPVAVAVENTGNPTINDGSGGVAAVAGAIKAWGIINASTTSADAVRGKVPATIMLHTNGNLCNGTCLAATLTGYYHQEGNAYYIDDADVYTNQKYSFTSSKETDGCSGEFDIDGVMVHEVGHVIGIAHSNVAGATMYPSVSACNIANRSLESDDIAAKNDLY